MTDSKQHKSIVHDCFIFFLCTTISLLCFPSGSDLLNLNTRLYNQDNGSTLQVMQVAVISVIEMRSQAIRAHHGCGMFGARGLAEVPTTRDV